MKTPKFSNARTQRTHSAHNRLFALAFLLSAGFFGCGAPNSDPSGLNNGAIDPVMSPINDIASDPIFVDATLEGRQMEAGRAGNPDHSDDLPEGRRKRYVRVNFRTLKRIAAKIETGATLPVSGILHLNVFEDETLAVALESIGKLGADNFVVNGKVSGDLDSAATLVINKEILVANIRKGESTESYEVRHASKGLHRIEVREDEDNEDCPAIPSPEPVAEDIPRGVDGIMAAAELDILAAYTPNARIKMGGADGIRALIQMGIADTNAALRESGSSLRVRLVGVMQVRQNETGNWSNDLSYLRRKGEGRWDEVHAERSRLGADQVSMIATYPRSGSTQGIGYIRAGASTAFSIVRATSFGSYTFSHELGHNLGLNHSDGYVNSAGRFRTIIAYGSYPRIRRYSNPDVEYKGLRTGTRSKDEVSIIDSNSNRASSLVPKKVVSGL